MRVVGGQFRGRALAAPTDQAIRPTSDRVREAVFNVLGHGVAAVDLEGARVLDLFAGTGALGIEALSRGAMQCLFVDDSADARGLIRENVEALGLTGITKVFRRDATALGDAGKYGTFGLVFLDPPYRQGLGERAVASALAGGWLSPRATIVLEEAKDADVRLPAGVIELDRRTWSDTMVLFARREATG
jgi:16S rRNA (guanine966-N2)-methyltransferase